MTNYKTTGVHQINQWLWNDLKTLEYGSGQKVFESYLTGGAMATKTPFIPAQQQAEFTNIAGGAPFIVYNYVLSTSPEWYRKKEQAAYAIYDNDISRLRAIHLRMADLLCREDVTAQEINRWLPLNTPWDFKYISLGSSTGPDEFLQEGGRQGATITCSYEFTHDLSAAGLRI